jgi:hypothetical protein
MKLMRRVSSKLEPFGLNEHASISLIVNRRFSVITLYLFCDTRMLVWLEVRFDDRCVDQRSEKNLRIQSKLWQLHTCRDHSSRKLYRQVIYILVSKFVMCSIKSKCHSARSAVLYTATHQQSCRFTHFFGPFMCVTCDINCATIHEWCTTPVREFRETYQHQVVLRQFSSHFVALFVCKHKYKRMQRDTGL